MGQNRSELGIVIGSTKICFILFAVSIAVNTFNPSKIELKIHGYSDNEKNETESSKINYMEIKEVAKLIDDRNIIFIDARNNAEYNSGHIKNAINISVRDFDEKFIFYGKNILNSNLVIIYCDSFCGLSKRLALMFIEKKVNKIFIYKGGWEEWVAAKLPTEIIKEDK
ncbi:MAG: rhodanese-like domain-containing protein [Candidatus Firestonebacteria bacterium]